MPIFKKYILFFTIAFFCLFNNLYAQDKEMEEQSLQMLNKDRERAEEEISNINNMLKSVDEKFISSNTRLSLLEQKISSRKSTLTTIDKQISTLKKQLEEKKLAVELLQKDLEAVKRSYKDLITRYYSMQSQKNTWLIYIMASESVSQAYKRMKYVREILFLLQAQAQKIADMTDRLNNEINEISNKQTLLSSNISDKQKEMEILKLEEKQSKTVYSEMKREATTLKKQLAERQEAYKAVNIKMRELMREEIKEKSQSGITEEMLIVAKDMKDMKGFLPQPTIGFIVSRFRETETESMYNVQLNSNDGIDIVTAKDAEVYAVFKGKVKQVTKIQGAGTCVLVQHGSYYTVYASMGSVSVKPGDEVKARQTIGTVLNSNHGSILHFELWKDNEVQNPEHWILNKIY